MTDDIQTRAAEVISRAMFGMTTPAMSREIALDLADAGLLASPERDAAVAAKALRDAEARAEVERLRSAADSLFEKALERGARGQLPGVNVVEISEAFQKETSSVPPTASSTATTCLPLGPERATRGDGTVKDFDQLPYDEQIARYREDYDRRDVGHGTNVRFMDDLGHMFVTEDCGGDLNVIIYGPDEGGVGFASLNPPEVIRLYEVLRERVGEWVVGVSDGGYLVHRDDLPDTTEGETDV